MQVANLHSGAPSIMDKDLAAKAADVDVYVHRADAQRTDGQNTNR